MKFSDFIEYKTGRIQRFVDQISGLDSRSTREISMLVSLLQATRHLLNLMQQMTEVSSQFKIIRYPPKNKIVLPHFNGLLLSWF